MNPAVGAGGENLVCLGAPICGHTVGVDAAVARLTCLLSSRVGRGTEMGLRSLLLFWFQSRWRTTAVLVLAACSVPVPR